MKDLAKLLRIPLPYAVGIMEMLWHHVSRFAIQGDIGKWPDKNIARAVGWAGNPERLVNALVESGWLDRDPDYRLLVHDWDQHADQSVSKTLKNKSIDFIKTTATHHIYFVRSLATGLVKIGTTRHQPIERLSELRARSGEPLELVTSFTGSYRVESEVHARFAHLKVDNGWFYPKPELVEFIALYCGISGIILETDRIVPSQPLPLPLPIPFHTVDGIIPTTRESEPNRISGETTAECVSKIKAIRKPKGEKLEPPEVETVIANISKNILTRHPKMRNGSMSINTVAKALRLIVRELELVDKIPRLLSIDENHAACCSQFEWQKEGGMYAKGLNNWLAPTMDRFDSRPDPDQSKPQQPAVKRIIATADMF